MLAPVEDALMADDDITIGEVSRRLEAFDKRTTESLRAIDDRLSAMQPLFVRADIYELQRQELTHEITRGIADGHARLSGLEADMNKIKTEQFERRVAAQTHKSRDERGQRQWGLIAKAVGAGFTAATTIALILATAGVIHP